MKKISMLLVCLCLILTLSMTTYAEYGDVNKDHVIDASDALSILKHVAKIEETEDTYLIDIDKNGVIEAADALYVLKYSAHIIDSLENLIKLDVADLSNVFIGDGDFKGSDDGMFLIDTYIEYMEILYGNNLSSYKEYNYDIYSEKYFENNMLLVAEISSSTSDANYEFNNFIESNEKNSIYLTRKSPLVAVDEEGCYVLLLPLSGKDWLIEDFELQVKDIVYDSCAICTNVEGMSLENEYPIVISSYKEYQEFRSNNPDFVWDKEYDENLWSTGLIIGQIWTDSMIEFDNIYIDYDNATYNIVFNQLESEGLGENICYNFIIETDRFAMLDLGITETNVMYTINIK